MPRATHTITFAALVAVRCRRPGGVYAPRETVVEERLGYGICNGKRFRAYHDAHPLTPSLSFASAAEAGQFSTPERRAIARRLQRAAPTDTGDLTAFDTDVGVAHRDRWIQACPSTADFFVGGVPVPVVAPR